MARPVQLRYNDTNDGETVIGTYLLQDNLIEQFQMKNSGSGEYTHIELLADKQVKDNLPIDYTQYGTAQNGENEPEILVYVYDTDNDTFVLRDRVFPENQGILEDDGSYRNNQLWGFQKWVGRKQVTNISESNATITEIMKSLLPSGYTAVTPGDDTVPTLDNYSFNGKIDRAIRDLVRDFPVKIWFTAELDSNNDYIVKVQSKGYGDVVQAVTFDDERQTEGYKINRFEEEDKSNIVNKVEIEGTDSNGNKISEIVEDTTSISEHGERYVHRNVGYLESSSQAQNIANDILSPDPSPHAEMAIPFQEQNILNASIDILDDRFGIDAVYTVVKQRDFMTEGRTEVELGFEKNRSEERRDRDRELDERNHQLFRSTSTDVGNQDFTGDTGDSLSDTSKDGGVGESGDRDNNKSDVAKDGTVNDETIESARGTTSTDSFTSQSVSGFRGVASVSGLKDGLLAHTFNIIISDISSTADLFIVVTDEINDDIIWADNQQSVGSNDTGNIADKTSRNYVKTFQINETFTASSYDLVIATSDGSTVDVSGSFTVDGLAHTHNENIGTVNNDMGLNDDIGTVDAPHGGGTGDNQHGTSGSTNPKDIDVAKEDKTDR